MDHAKGCQALVADHAAREAGQDRRQGDPARSVRHVPIGRGGGAEGPVPEDSASDRPVAAKARPRTR